MCNRDSELISKWPAKTDCDAVRAVFVPAQVTLGLGYIGILTLLWETGRKRVLVWL